MDVTQRISREIVIWDEAGKGVLLAGELFSRLSLVAVNGFGTPVVSYAPRPMFKRNPIIQMKMF